VLILFSLARQFESCCFLDIRERPSSVWRAFDCAFQSLSRKASEVPFDHVWRNTMSKRIYVGNLSYQTTENDLASLFEQVGEVESVNIITDRDTGRSKGFGFVEMGSDEADKAIAQFNGTEINGRTITVNEARPREDRSGNRGGGGGFGGGGGGGRRNSGGGGGGGRGRGGFGNRY
jgi:cold-inducible RNA-binding protein